MNNDTTARSKETLAMVDNVWMMGQTKILLTIEQFNDLRFVDDRNDVSMETERAVLMTGKFATYKNTLEIWVGQ